MYMSANMYRGLTALLDVNADLNKYQTQALTGKRINQASDGLAAYLTSQGFDSRSSRLQSLNDGLTSVLSTVTSAKTGLEQIKKTLVELRNTLKAASETQGTQAAQGVQQVADSDPNNTQFSFNLSARLGKAANGVSGAASGITVDTLLTQANDAGADPAVNQSQVFIGNQAMREGMSLKMSAGGKSWTFIVGRTGANGVADPALEETDTNSTTVYTVGQLFIAMRDKLGIDTSMLTNGTTGTVQATYNGPGFSKDGNGVPDLSKPQGVSINVDYAATGATPANGYGAHETYDVNGNGGYMNVNSMFAVGRGANNNKVTYTEDQKATFVNGGVVAFGTTGNRSTFEKTTANVAYNGNQTARFVGVQHNYKAAVDAKTADPARANAAKAYREAMKTINSYVNDSVSSGINLLYGASLRVTLNEEGLSQAVQLTNSAGQPMAFTANAMNLVDGGGNAVDANGNFATNIEGLPGLMTAIDKIDKAMDYIDIGATQVASYQASLQGRKDFNSAIVKLLNQSSVDLTSADPTEVAARQSALQVQQGFGQSILASTKNSEQSLLQLLR